MKVVKAPEPDAVLEMDREEASTFIEQSNGLVFKQDGKNGPLFWMLIHGHWILIAEIETGDQSTIAKVPS